MTYSEQILDPRWQRRRLEVLNRANWHCEDCPALDVQLHVHHVYYLYGHSIWDYPDYLLKCVCGNCHKRRANVEQAIFCAVAQVLCGLTVEEMQEQPIFEMFDCGPVRPDFTAERKMLMERSVA